MLAVDVVLSFVDVVLSFVDVVGSIFNIISISKLNHTL